ncbi:MAG: hypothetical protein HOG89_00620 [Candidatus Peribacter sp.]|jgi:hypothetical protein|nr:hypothetical protein [Candidatus Peribacter sp.]MBT4392972.1 hypothetical protein [Candidatus Peribacter sp.]MBT4601032.1 hypothetical protein [Candidatus Peribacter sp.]MBT5149606.1 hypothetical protein [Candidatus Peribacter sp.]MBT5637480.1 hypothetical protein [Candidatus Peribacter sp.]
MNDQRLHPETCLGGRDINRALSKSLSHEEATALTMAAGGADGFRYDFAQVGMALSAYQMITEQHLTIEDVLQASREGTLPVGCGEVIRTLKGAISKLRDEGVIHAYELMKQNAATMRLKHES